MLSYQYRNSHDKNEVVSWPSYLYNEEPYTWKDGLHIEMGPRYWVKPRLYRLIEYSWFKFCFFLKVNINGGNSWATLGPFPALSGNNDVVHIRTRDSASVVFLSLLVCHRPLQLLVLSVVWKWYKSLWFCLALQLPGLYIDGLVQKLDESNVFRVNWYSVLPIAINMYLGFILMPSWCKKAVGHEFHVSLHP